MIPSVLQLIAKASLYRVAINLGFVILESRGKLTNVTLGYYNQVMDKCALHNLMQWQVHTFQVI